MDVLYIFLINIEIHKFEQGCIKHNDHMQIKIKNTCVSYHAKPQPAEWNLSFLFQGISNVNGQTLKKKLNLFILLALLIWKTKTSWGWALYLNQVIL